MERDGARADAVHNRQLAIDAVGRLLGAGGVITLTNIAAEAGVSRATAYRNFAGPEDAINAYIESFLQMFEQAAASVDGLEAVCAVWAELVASHSTALVHVRSTEGFLARVRSGDAIITRIHRIMLDAFQADPADQRDAADDAKGAIAQVIDVDYAIYLWNLLLDPRELLDLATHLGVSVPEAAARQTALLRVCLDAMVADAQG